MASDLSGMCSWMRASQESRFFCKVTAGFAGIPCTAWGSETVMLAAVVYSSRFGTWQFYSGLCQVLTRERIVNHSLENLLK